MGHFFVKLSHWMAMLIVVLMNASLVKTQNCFFDAKNTTQDGANGGKLVIIIGEPIMETTETGTVIWNVATENVKSSVASPNPDSKYLTGLRYPNSYVYRTTEEFEGFIEAERRTEVQRNVTYTCADEKTMRVHFKFPLIDVNNHSPQFLKLPDQQLEATLCSDEFLNMDDTILIEDKDFSSENNNVTITSDRPEMLIITQEIVDSESQNIGKLYKVLLKLNTTTACDNIKQGLYTISLFSTDGQFTESGRIMINVKAKN